ncbi:MAG: response regulator [Gammaproteobacteria bacterium]|nr:response regulator [Gammaproteobacteria bacterium]
MAGVIEGIQELTELAGNNRMELLMFHLANRNHRYGINVFKVQEVTQCPPLTKMPGSHPCAAGIAVIRGRSIPVFDLAKAIGLEPLESYDNCFVIVTEYNRSVQGYAVYGVDRIINTNWSDVMPPPKTLGQNCYLTAVTRGDDQFVEIIDIEKVLDEVDEAREEISFEFSEAGQHQIQEAGWIILVVDDSAVARKHITTPLRSLGLQVITARDGKEALELLQEWNRNDPKMIASLAMVLSDIEMPEMDGYTLTTKIREDQRLSKLHVVLHSSVTGVFNQAMVEKVGADLFIPKFDPDELATIVINRLKEFQSSKLIA